MDGDDRWASPEGSDESASGDRSRWEVGPIESQSGVDAETGLGSAEEAVSTPEDGPDETGVESSSGYRWSDRRRSRHQGRPRTVRHVVKVHPEVEEQLIAKAAEHGYKSVAELLVESALAGGAEAAQAKHELVGELWRVVRVVGKVGVNVNQIARATNATLETQPDTAAAMAAAARVCERIEAFLDELGVESGASTSPASPAPVAATGPPGQPGGGVAR